MTALVFVMSTALGTGIASAKTTTPGKLNAEGRAACHALGKNGYAAKVRGEQYGDHTFFDHFNIRYCFSNKQECVRFINNIDHLIYPIEKIHYANCKKV